MIEKVDPAQDFCRLLLARSGAGMAIASGRTGERDVVPDAQSLEELITLERAGKPVRPHLVGPQPGGRPARKVDRAGARRELARDHVEQSRFAGPVRTDDGAPLALQDD